MLLPGYSAAHYGALGPGREEAVRVAAAEEEAVRVAATREEAVRAAAACKYLERSTELQR